MVKRKKHNPGYVSIRSCNQTHKLLEGKVTEVLYTLRGNPKNHKDTGLVGEFREMKAVNQRDRKWIYAILTLIIIPLLWLLFNYFKP